MLLLWRVTLTLLRAEARPLARRQAPWALGLFFVAFVGVQAIPWAWVQRETLGAAPWALGLGVAVAVGLVALVVAPIARSGLYGPSWRYWRRQPLGPAWLSPALTLLSLAWVLPLVAFGAAFWPVGVSGLVVPGAGAAMALLVGASDHRWRWAFVAGVCVAYGALAAGVQAAPWLDLPLSAWSLLLLGGLAGPLHRRLQAVPQSSAIAVPWVPRGAFMALLQRDVLSLARLAPRWLFLVLVPPIPVWLFLRVLADRGWTSAQRTTAAGLMLLLAAPVVTGMLVRVRLLLGGQFDPRRWPLRPWQRFAGLGLLAGGALMPTWAAAAASSSVSWVDQLDLGGQATALALAWAWGALAPRIQAVPSRVLWVSMAGGAGLLLDPIGPLFAALVGLACSWLGTRDLRRARKQA